MSWHSRLFSDEGKHLDRFGLVLGLSVVSIMILLIIDLDNVTDNIWSEIGWLAVTIIVGATLSSAIRAGGVARRPRIVVDIVVWISIASVTVISVTDNVTTSVGEVSGRPSVVWAVIALFAPVLVLRRVMMQRTVTTETLWGAMAVYLLVGLAFAYAFMALPQITGELFFGTEQPTTVFMYFSLVTLTTLGYGDFFPVTELGRFLASTEALIGQVLVITVVSRIVSVYTRTTVPKAADVEPTEG